jgi:hypothetical protein
VEEAIKLWKLKKDKKGKRVIARPSPSKPFTLRGKALRNAKKQK